MSNVTVPTNLIPLRISQAPQAALPLSGSESVPIVQNGITSQTTTAAIGGIPGSITPKVQTISGAFGALTLGPYLNTIYLNAAAGAVTAALPVLNVTPGCRVRFKLNNATYAATITIVGAAVLFDYSTTFIQLRIAQQAAEVEFDGTTWRLFQWP